MLLVGILYGSLHIDSVQTFFAKRLTTYLSKELNTKVYIDRVSFRFIKSIDLKGFYVEDQHGDTLIYSDQLSISISDISTKDRSLIINKLILEKAQFNLVKYKGESFNNLHFISEYFSSNDTSASGKPWNINVSNLVLRDVTKLQKLISDSAYNFVIFAPKKLSDHVYYEVYLSKEAHTLDFKTMAIVPSGDNANPSPPKL